MDGKKRADGEPADSAAELQKESAAIALEAIALKQRELDARKMKHEQDLATAAENAYRALLDFKQQLGLPGHPNATATGGAGGGGGAAAFRPSLDPGRVMDDPRFATLSVGDQEQLLAMSLDQQWDIGWGPYPEQAGVGAKHGPGAAHAGYAPAHAGDRGVQYDPELMPEFLFLRAGEPRKSPVQPGCPVPCQR